MIIQVEAIEQYFPAVLFIMLYKAVLTFESMDEILKCDHSKLLRSTFLTMTFPWCCLFSTVSKIKFGIQTLLGVRVLRLGLKVNFCFPKI